MMDLTPFFFIVKKGLSYWLEFDLLWKSISKDSLDPLDYLLIYLEFDNFCCILFFNYLRSFLFTIGSGVNWGDVCGVLLFFLALTGTAAGMVHNLA